MAQGGNIFGDIGHFFGLGEGSDLSGGVFAKGHPHYIKHKKRKPKKGGNILGDIGDTLGSVFGLGGGVLAGGRYPIVDSGLPVGATVDHMGRPLLTPSGRPAIVNKRHKIVSLAKHKAGQKHSNLGAYLSK